MLNVVSARLTATPPSIQVLLAIVSIQLGAAFAINLFPVLGPAGTVFCRLLISAMLLFLFIRPKINKGIFRHSKLLLTYGITLALMNWCFYESISRIPLGIAVAIEFVGPLSVGVFTSRRKLDLLWVALALAGLLILTPEFGSNLDPVGVIYAVFAGIGWGGFVLLSKRVSKDLNGNDGLVYGMIVASFFMLPIAGVSVVPLLNTVSLIGSVIALAILSTTIPFFLEFSALKKLPPVTYGVLITLEPVVASVVGAIALGDRLGVSGVLAIFFVTAAVIGATLTQKTE